MIKWLRKLRDKIAYGPELEYRVRYEKDTVWNLPGYYLEVRGGGYGYFWSIAHSRPFDTEQQAYLGLRRMVEDFGGVIRYEKSKTAARNKGPRTRPKR